VIFNAKVAFVEFRASSARTIPGENVINTASSSKAHSFFIYSPHSNGIGKNISLSKNFFEFFKYEQRDLSRLSPYDSRKRLAE
jgi:hypothetical protein